MLNWQKPYLPNRNKLKEIHDACIENAYITDTIPDKHFRRICRKVFTLHSIEFPFFTPPPWPDEKEFNTTTLPMGLDNWISYYFHTEHYQMPEHLIKGIAYDAGKIPVKKDFFASRGLTQSISCYYTQINSKRLVFIS